MLLLSSNRFAPQAQTLPPSQTPGAPYSKVDGKKIEGGLGIYKCGCCRAKLRGRWGYDIQWEKWCGVSLGHIHYQIKVVLFKWLQWEGMGLGEDKDKGIWCFSASASCTGVLVQIPASLLPILFVLMHLGNSTWNTQVLGGRGLLATWETQLEFLTRLWHSLLLPAVVIWAADQQMEFILLVLVFSSTPNPPPLTLLPCLSNK